MAYQLPNTHIRRSVILTPTLPLQSNPFNAPRLGYDQAHHEDV